VGNELQALGTMISLSPRGSLGVGVGSQECVKGGHAQCSETPTDPSKPPELERQAAQRSFFLAPRVFRTADVVTERQRRNVLDGSGGQYRPYIEP
jgi:hypothetical protein